jgi:DNA invertase Pin-like site-specific DNA recombinase
LGISRSTVYRRISKYNLKESSMSNWDEISKWHKPLK